MSTTRPIVIARALVLMTAAVQTMPAMANPPVKYMEVKDARLPYVEAGSGPPVIFVHGAVADYRAWNVQRSMLAKQGYRAISYTQRYFGTEKWNANGPPFGVITHAEDLAAFLSGLKAGPVHVVTWSYGAQVAFGAALDKPDLVKSLFQFGPAQPTFASESVMKRIEEDAPKTFGGAAKAVEGNNGKEAVRQLINGVSGGGTGYFEKMPSEFQSILLESSHTVAPMFKVPPLQISCEQLGTIKVPTAIAWGTGTEPYFKHIANEATRCMPSAKTIAIPDANHMWPSEQPEKFISTLVGFLKDK